MSDFVSDLRRELVAAAEREERRRLPALPRLRPLLPALAVAALLAIAAVVAISLLPHEDRQVAKPRGEAKPLFGGTLEPGVRYRPRGFGPPLELSVADRRWNAELVEPATVVLSRQPLAGSPAPPLGFVAFVTGPFRVYDPDIRGTTRSLRMAPEDYLAWLRAHPDIEAQAPRPTTLAGHEARVMDLRFRFDRPAHAALQCKGMGFQCSALGPGEDAHRDGERERVWAVKTSAGTMYVFVVGFDATAFGDVERAAAPMLDGLKIGG